MEVEHETNPIPLYDGPDQIPIGRPGIGVGIGARPAASDDGVGTRQLGHQGGHPGGVLVLLLLLPIAHMGGAVGRGDEDGHAAGNVEELGLIPPCQPAIADVGLEADEALDQAGRVGNPSLHEGSIAHGGLGHKGISCEARSPRADHHQVVGDGLSRVHQELGIEVLDGVAGGAGEIVPGAVDGQPGVGLIAPPPTGVEGELPAGQRLGIDAEAAGALVEGAGQASALLVPVEGLLAGRQTHQVDLGPRILDPLDHRRVIDQVAAPVDVEGGEDHRAPRHEADLLPQPGHLHHHRHAAGVLVGAGEDGAIVGHGPPVGCGDQDPVALGGLVGAGDVADDVDRIDLLVLKSGLDADRDPRVDPHLLPRLQVGHQLIQIEPHGREKLPGSRLADEQIGPATHIAVGIERETAKGTHPDGGDIGAPEFIIGHHDQQDRVVGAGVMANVAAVLRAEGEHDLFHRPFAIQIPHDDQFLLPRIRPLEIPLRGEGDPLAELELSPIVIEHRDGGFSDDLPPDAGVGLVVVTPRHLRQIRLLELGGDVGRSGVATAGAGRATCELRATEIGDIVPGPLEVEVLRHLGILGLDAAAGQQSLGAPKNEADDDEEPEHGPAAGVETPLFDEALQTVTEEVEAQNGDEERDRRGQWKPGHGAEVGPGGAEHGAPVGHLEEMDHVPHIDGVVDVDPTAADEDVDEAQLAQDQKHPAHLQGRQREEGSQQIGEDVSAEDLGRAEANGTRGEDEEAIAQGEDVATHDLSHLAPPNEGEGYDEGDLPSPDADGEDEEDGQDQGRNGGQELGDGGDGAVEERMRPPAGESPQDQTQQKPDGHGDESDNQGLAGAVEKHREHIAALVVGAERILLGGRKGRTLEFAVDGLDPIPPKRVMWRHLGSDDGEEDEARHQHGAEDEGSVPHGASQALPEGLGFHRRSSRWEPRRSAWAFAPTYLYIPNRRPTFKPRVDSVRGWRGATRRTPSAGRSRPPGE
ncbi:MAG: hypothetical protein BAJATHORv1_140002 [Candidatus Thorarchaeota archaeon]|nr:MAG: hypothetical protein BAJATHORv1_140002 [Candidatus Thorarchaeota archaeon]